MCAYMITWDDKVLYSVFVDGVYECGEVFGQCSE